MTLADALDDLDAWPSVDDEAVESLPDEVDVGDVVAHATVEENLNLNAIAIGLGLERISHEPDEYPGLIFRPDGVDTTSLLFGDGTILSVGAKKPSDAETAIRATIDRVEELGLVSGDSAGDIRTRAFETSATEETTPTNEQDERGSIDFNDPAGRAAELRELAMDGTIEGDPPVRPLRKLLESDDASARVDSAAALAALGTTDADAIDPMLEDVTETLFAREDTELLAEHHLRGIQDLESSGVGAGTILSGVETALEVAHEKISDLEDQVGTGVVPDGGATEAAVANAIREAAEQAPGRTQLVVEGVADAVEAVPTEVAKRAGMDPIDAVVDLRTRHMREDVTAGIDPDTGEVTDVVEAGITHPASEAWLRIADGIWAGTLVWSVRGTVSQLDILDQTEVHEVTGDNSRSSKPDEKRRNVSVDADATLGSAVSAVTQGEATPTEVRRLGELLPEERLPDEAATALEDLAESDDPEIRLAVCEVCATVDDDRATGILEQCRLDSDDRVVSAALDGLS